jgi:hypothetical protein
MTGAADELDAAGLAAVPVDREAFCLESLVVSAGPTRLDDLNRIRYHLINLNLLTLVCAKIRR